jgi:hypothetical protein
MEFPPGTQYFRFCRLQSLLNGDNIDTVFGLDSRVTPRDLHTDCSCTEIDAELASHAASPHRMLCCRKNVFQTTNREQT